MDLLADESVDFPIIKWLRDRGHDVVAIADSSAGASDVQVLQLAVAQGRVLLTFDRHFGELVFRNQIKPPGLVYVRIRTSSAAALYRRFQSLWPTIESRILGRFVIMSAHRIRLRAL